jgi:hypothetical protein
VERRVVRPVDGRVERRRRVEVILPLRLRRRRSRC